MEGKTLSASPAEAVPTDSVLAIAQSLIRTPSQAGIDRRKPVLDVIAGWLSSRGFDSIVLRDAADEDLGILVELVGDGGGPVYCLNACADTAPVGNVAAWRAPPFSGTVDNGWLYGRGSADSKIAIAVFLHLLTRLSTEKERLRGTLSVLFDADEHTGRFGGIRAYLERRPNVAGVMIGYPGNYGVIVGARGFFRAQVRVYGSAAHSGTTKKGLANAVEKAADLVSRLSNGALTFAPDPDFEFGPKLTVTSINGGEGYSTIPDCCDVNVDVRLTRTFNADHAAQLLKRVVEENNRSFPSPRANTVIRQPTLPAYRLSNESLVASALRRGASLALGHDVPAVVCGPSNAGNLFAEVGVDATCGFGVTYKHIHGTDERIEIASIEPAFLAYQHAVRCLLFDV